MQRHIVANCDSHPAAPEQTLGKRIAIVEDEAAIRENYAAAFRREGYSVDVFDARKPALDASALSTDVVPDFSTLDCSRHCGRYRST